MRVATFSLYIPEGRERSSGHVEMAHGSTYKLILDNHSHRRCDASVVIDGKPIGTFRLDARSGLTLETPPDDPSKGCFTFYVVDTQEYVAAAGGSVAVDQRGLIQVTFRPEKQQAYIPHKRQYTNSTKGRIRGATYQSEINPASGQLLSFDEGLVQTSAGITGLSGQSKQTFTNVGRIAYDAESTVVITVRLVSGVGNGPRPLQPAVSVPRANPIPDPVV